MAADSEQNDSERRGKERVADTADWETKTLARVRSRLKQAPPAENAPDENSWEQEVLRAMRDKLDKP